MSRIMSFFLVTTAFLFVFTTLPRCSYAMCKINKNFLVCRDEIPPDAMIENMSGEVDVNIHQTQANFTSLGSEHREEGKVRSLQIRNSVIFGLQPRYFSKFSGQALRHLIIHSVTGEYRLDASTLGGLENVLVELRMSGKAAIDLSALVAFKRLTSLQLVRLGINSLPANFRRILPQLEQLDLSNNELTTFPWDALAEALMSERTKRIKLVQNQWNCDCSIVPILNLPANIRQSITGFVCATPDHLRGQELLLLKVADVCEKTVEEPVVGPPVLMHKPEEEVASPAKPEAKVYDAKTKDTGGEAVKPANMGEPAIQTTEPTVAAAGLRVEVIAVIVTLVIVVVLVLVGVIAYRVRVSKQRKRAQGGTGGVSHKTNSYVSVIERPPPLSTTTPSQSHTRNYGQMPDYSEREPLSSRYHQGRAL